MEKRREENGKRTWWEQIRRSPLPGQVLKLKAEAGRQRWSRHNMLGPQAVPSST